VERIHQCDGLLGQQGSFLDQIFIYPVLTAVRCQRRDLASRRGLARQRLRGRRLGRRRLDVRRLRGQRLGRNTVACPWSRTATQLPQPGNGAGVHRVDVQRSAIEVGSIRAGVVLLSYVAKLKKGICMPRIEADRLLEVTLRHRQIVLRQREHTEPVMCFGRRGRDGRSLPKTPAAFVIPALF